jgi:hypothetical protein
LCSLWFKRFRVLSAIPVKNFFAEKNELPELFFRKSMALP